MAWVFAFLIGIVTLPYQLWRNWLERRRARRDAADPSKISSD